MRRLMPTATFNAWLGVLVTIVTLSTIGHHFWALPGGQSSPDQEAVQLVHGSLKQNNAAKTSERGSSSPSRYAYVFYVADNAYGCGALVNMAQLKEAEGGLPENVDLIIVAKDGAVADALLEAAKQEMGAIVHLTSSFGEDAEMGLPIGDKAGFYADCFLKFLAFLLPSDVYRRLILMDADSLVLRPPHHLFHLPDELPLVAPSAYWLRPQWVSVTNWLMSIRPSRELYETLRARLQELRSEVSLGFGSIIFSTGRRDVYDMDLFNIVFEKDITVLPPVYGMLDSELVENDHAHLGPLDAIMNGSSGVAWAVHFSGGGKPMTDRIDPAEMEGAHPGYTRLIKVWTETARRVCPPGTFPSP